MKESAYFVTVKWCHTGTRGIFCSNTGQPFRNDAPHTDDEMVRILGPFWLILKPKSELFTIDQVAEHTRFTPLEEYSNQYGIACRVAAVGSEQ